MSNSKSSNKITPEKIRAALKKARFRSAYRYASGKLQGGGRLVNANTWSEGYRVEEEGGAVKAYYQMEIYRSETCRAWAQRYKDALEAAGFKCYINGRHEVVIAGKAEAAKQGDERPAPPSLFAAEPEG